MSTDTKSERLATRKSTRGFGGPHASERGFSLIELLIGMTIMAIALLSIASMFSTGYTDITAGGKTTMATAAARQILEDIQTLQTLQFANLPNLNNMGGNCTTGLPAANPERALVRKWRYALAGDDAACAFTIAEKAAWSTLTISGVNLGATGLITVVDQNNPPTLRLVTVTVSIPGRPNVQLATLISRL